MPTTQPVFDSQLYDLVSFGVSGVVWGLGFLAGLYAWRLVLLGKNQSKLFGVLLAVGWSSVARADSTVGYSTIAALPTVTLTLHAVHSWDKLVGGPPTVGATGGAVSAWPSGGQFYDFWTGNCVAGTPQLSLAIPTPTGVATHSPPGSMYAAGVQITQCALFPQSDGTYLGAALVWHAAPASVNPTYGTTGYAQQSGYSEVTTSYGPSQWMLPAPQGITGNYAVAGPAKLWVRLGAENTYVEFWVEGYSLTRLYLQTTSTYQIGTGVQAYGVSGTFAWLDSVGGVVSQGDQAIVYGLLQPQPTTQLSSGGSAGTTQPVGVSQVSATSQPGPKADDAMQKVKDALAKKVPDYSAIVTATDNPGQLPTWTVHLPWLQGDSLDIPLAFDGSGPLGMQQGIDQLRQIVRDVCLVWLTLANFNLLIWLTANW